MAAGVKTRIKLPKQVQAGEVVTIKTLITHQMESGQRRTEQGATIPRSIINRFRCSFEGETVVDIDLGPGIQPTHSLRSRPACRGRACSHSPGMTMTAPFTPVAG